MLLQRFCQAMGCRGLSRKSLSMGGTADELETNLLVAVFGKHHRAFVSAELNIVSREPAGNLAGFPLVVEAGLDTLRVPRAR
jgi:hypothetical protein